MFCTKCGKPIPQGAKFCPHCGATQTVTAAEQAEQPVPNPVRQASTDTPIPTSSPEKPKARPWIRFLARLFDIIFASYLLGFAAVYFYPEEFLQILSKPGGETLAGLAFLFAWVFIEPILLEAFGTTPGKWLFNIRLVPPKKYGKPGVITPQTDKPDYSTALSRSFDVWWRGLGLGLPFVTLFTNAAAYTNLKKNGITTWDRNGGFTVVHGRIGLLRVLFAIVFFSASLALVAFSNFLTSTPATSTKAAGMDYTAETSGAKPWERVYKPAETAGMDAENEVVKLRKAAEQGDAKAQSDLGFMYYIGESVPQDYAQAATWFHKAAEQGLAPAQYNLGVMYDNGRGVPQEHAQAVTWYRKAAENGFAAAQYYFGVRYEKGVGMAQDYAQALAWYRKAADQGFADAQFNLGAMYFKGRGVPQDYAQAATWYRKAAEQGDSNAQNNLGTMYEFGQGVPQDYAQAATWYRKAAEQGSADAQFNLGAMYANGQSVPQNDAQAVTWYRKAAEQGFAKAQNNLGVMYANGEGVPQDNVMAYALYNLAAASGFSVAVKNRDTMAMDLSPKELSEAQALSRSWKPGMPLGR